MQNNQRGNCDLGPLFGIGFFVLILMGIGSLVVSCDENSFTKSCDAKHGIVVKGVDAKLYCVDAKAIK